MINVMSNKFNNWLKMYKLPLPIYFDGEDCVTLQKEDLSYPLATYDNFNNSVLIKKELQPGDTVLLEEGVFELDDNMFLQQDFNHLA